MTSLMRRLCIVFIFLSSFSEAAKWSFDQRQILLAQTEGSDFPDDLTTAQILDAFVVKGRIRFVTHKTGASPVTPLKVPADFIWSSAPSVRQLGLKYQADGILLLRKKGVRVELEWYSVKDGEPLFFESQSLPEASEAQEAIRKERIQKWISEIWSKIPGQGYIMRRDLDSVYIEGAKQEGLRVGDRVDLLRILRSEKHPVLKTLMRVETSQTGVAVLTDVEEPLSRAKIEYESPADPIETGDRYQIRPAAPQAPVAAMPQTIPSSPEQQQVPEQAQKEPRIADLSVLGMIGSVRHSEKFNSTNTHKMSATAPGLEVQARGYLTREWLADFHFGFNFFKFRDVPAQYGTDSISSGTRNWRLNGGYRLFFMEDMMPSGELIISLGYSKYSLKMGTTTTDLAPQAKTYSGFEFGLKLQVPVVYRFAANVQVYRTLGTGLSESPKSAGASSSNSAWQFQLGGKYVLTEIQEVFAGIRYTSLGSEYDGQGSRGVPSESTSVTSTMFLGGYTHKF